MPTTDDEDIAKADEGMKRNAGTERFYRAASKSRVNRWVLGDQAVKDYADDATASHDDMQTWAERGMQARRERARKQRARAGGKKR